MRRQNTYFFFKNTDPFPVLVLTGCGRPRRGRPFKNFKSGQVASLNWELGTQLKLGGERIGVEMFFFFLDFKLFYTVAIQ